MEKKIAPSERKAQELEALRVHIKVLAEVSGIR
jgi:hypothetical protein